MPGRLFDELAAGGGSQEAVAFLLKGERARRLLLLRDLLDRLDEIPDVLGPLGEVTRVWEVLEAAALRAPDAVDGLLMSPQCGAWIAHALRRLHGAASGPPLWADVGHLACLAASASVLAGTDADLALPARAGALSLPMLGLIQLPDCALEFSAVPVVIRSGRVTAGPVAVRPLGTAGDVPGWQPLRTLRPGGIRLDDLDPYRDLDGPIAPDRLSADEVAHWEKAVEEAHGILARGPGPGTAGAIRPGDITRIVPWPSAQRPGIRLSASTGDAFGSMVASRPDSGLDLAETLVHEFQHSKLGALLHLFPLLADDRTERFYAPWRADPRHLPGLLHGAYAFTGVAGFWRARMGDRAADPENVAPFHFALRRLQSRLVVRTLATHAELAPAGRRLLAGLAATLDRWLREPVDPAVAARARASAVSHRTEWRLRNLRCGPAERAALARAHREGGPPPRGFEPEPAPGGPAVHWEDTRAARYLSPRPGPDADAFLTTGDPARARELYEARLREAPDDAHALSGLLLARARLDPRARRLLARPERVTAALDVVGGDTDEAVRWLAGLSR
ncbi:MULTISPECIES: HEXXH motif domain-containing protein [unclassified Streptomyces]|uniref:HEXXH motif domain-containing protein n=1 Tax=unclassified Streptomyces TaxID=2593676 RepID=UPI000DB9FE73|nr:MULTISPECIES: HEXXH motif domain-containing protein [unclassified Streptomyces]MYT74437.1 HEXXH motif domain-containing protein [Streptomyces sp. SID8367]RAJ91415.1 HEXXH motif-containing protein [Streptomyces sp. PsTaAH-137]